MDLSTSSFLEKLNNEQKQAVLYNDGPLQIVAGPGSGKTRTLTYKVAYLINFKNVLPYRILAITFTNKATSEMSQRIGGLIDDNNLPVVKTYHAFCAMILKIEANEFGYPKNFRIIDEIDQKQIVQPICKDVGIDLKELKVRTIIGRISHYKSREISSDDAIDMAEDATDRKIARVYKKYQNELKKLLALDFDDILIFARDLLLNNEIVRKKWQAKYDYILIDEFQDTSQIQYDIVKLLAPGSIVTVVGDPDQNIYSWRAADIKFINNFNDDFENVELIKLEENYRSTKKIIDISNRLIRNNVDRIPKELYTSNSFGQAPQAFEMYTDQVEARWVSQKIQKLLAEGVNPKQIAIIYRANYIARYLETSLIEHNLSYIVYGGIKFFLRQEIKDAIAYLHLLNAWDDISLQRIINVPSRKIGTTSLNKMLEKSLKSNMTFSEFVTSESDISSTLKPSQVRSVSRFVEAIFRHRKYLKENKISQTLKSLLETSGYFNYLKENDELSRIENVNELIKAIEIWEKDNPNMSLDDYLAEIALYTENSSQNQLAQEAVSLMTVHASKGLEFKYVFLPSFSQSVFPSQKSLENINGLEEERRLAYVAITRAKSNFFISTHQGFSGRFQDKKRPSQFISEMGLNLLKPSTVGDSTSNWNLNKRVNNLVFVEGDFVQHDVFGVGEVLLIENNLITIKFRSPYGIKTLIKTHRSLKKV